MSIEHDLLSRMFEEDLSMARGLMAIKDYHMAAQTLDRAIEKIHQIAAVDPEFQSERLAVGLDHITLPAIDIPSQQLPQD